MHQPPLYLLDATAKAQFPQACQALAEPNGLLAVGGALSPAWLLEAYRHAIFPWFSANEPILWWSPDPRCLFMMDDFKPSRSLKKHMRRSHWQLSIDRDFVQVINTCASQHAANGTWITHEMISAYIRMAELGHAHSIEIWDQDKLVGGLYGIAVGRLFCGESMFSIKSNGSKVAIACLAALMNQWQMPILDAQVSNPHLLSLGAITVQRTQFIDISRMLVNCKPHPEAFKLEGYMRVSNFIA